MPRHRCPFVQQVSRPSASVDRESREAGLDVLSDVLRAVRLTGAIYFDIHAHAPWVAESPPVETICGSVMPDFEHVICFHILMRSEGHPSELQSLMRISYAFFCLKKK